MTAEQACALWPPVLAAARRHGLSVGSPSANHCAPGGGEPARVPAVICATGVRLCISATSLYLGNSLRD